MNGNRFKNYAEWEQAAPKAIKADKVWTVDAYRLSLFLGDRACGSISTNLSEGYSRRSARDQARLFEYSLGSARECRDWYYKGRFVLGEKVAEHRLALTTSIIRLLLASIPRQRNYSVSENESDYGSSTDLNTLLAADVPFPET